MNSRKIPLVVLAALVAVVLSLMLAPTESARAANGSRWFTSFEGIFVPSVSRSDVAQLVDAGSVETDGFSDLVFSLGGEFKEGVPKGGSVGAILLPDEEVVDYLLRNEGYFVFPLEVRTDVSGLSTHVFMSDQQTAKVAFPRYRIYLYNETGSAAKVSLYVYRSR